MLGPVEYPPGFGLAACTFRERLTLSSRIFRRGNGEGMGRIPFVVCDTKPLTVHFPGMTAHEGRSGEIPSDAGIMNVMNMVIMTQPMMFSAKPARAISFVEI